MFERQNLGMRGQFAYMYVRRYMYSKQFQFMWFTKF